MLTKIRKFFSLCIILCFVALWIETFIFYTPASAAAKTYYVAANGSDSTGDGSSIRPWKTIFYAASKVPGGQGNTIYIKAGTYTETQTIKIPVRVNVKGAGSSKTIINASFTNFLFNLSSPNPVTGNQRLSDFAIDGQGRKLTTGIVVHARDYVTITNIKVSNCDYTGIRVSGKKEVKYAKGIKVYNCTFENCSKDTPSHSSGALEVGGLEGAEIYNNTIREDQGYGIKFCNDGWLKGIKIHDNDISVNNYDASWTCDCAIELWNASYGSEVYNNRTDSWISLVLKQAPPKGVTAMKCYNNVLIPKRLDFPLHLIEAATCNTEVYGNYLQQTGWGFGIWQEDVDNLTIRNNVINNPRKTDMGMDIHVDSSVYSNIKILNNVFNNVSKGIRIEAKGKNVIENLQIRNNVFTECSFSVLHTYREAQIKNLSLTNNIFFNISKIQKSAMGKTLIFTQKNNYTVNPEFKKTGTLPQDFKQYFSPASEKSPLVDKGYNVGLPFKGKAPDIGAFEFEK